MPAATPIVLDLFDVFENPRVELTVEGMVWLLLARTRFEEIRTPPSPLTQPPPKGICSDLVFKGHDHWRSHTDRQRSLLFAQWVSSRASHQLWPCAILYRPVLHCVSCCRPGNWECFQRHDLNLSLLVTGQKIERVRARGNRKVNQHILGSREIKSLWSIGCRNELIWPCW